MTVRTYWAWETTATLRLLGGARSWGAHGVEGQGHIVSPRALLVSALFFAVKTAVDTATTTVLYISINCEAGLLNELEMMTFAGILICDRRVRSRTF